jgi:hypothetical protein
MDVAKAVELVVLILSPTLAVGALLHTPRAWRAIGRAVRGRRVRGELPIAGPPIERLAANLRRLLHIHEALRCSPDVAMRAHRLHALEWAITDCALETARALDIPAPQGYVRGALATPELRRLLRALADGGLVLPPAVGLLAA